MVRDFDNNYWSATVTAGAAIDDDTNLRLLYSYYRADNYEDNSSISQPYGADAEEHAISVALARKVSDHLDWSVRTGFITNQEDTTGGYNDYDATFVQTIVGYRF